MVERRGPNSSHLQQLWQEGNRYQDEARQLWARSVQLHAEGDRRGCDEAERDARLAEVRAREVEEKNIDTSPQSMENALVYARLLADFIGDGLWMIAATRDASVSNLDVCFGQTRVTARCQ